MSVTSDALPRPRPPPQRRQRLDSFRNPQPRPPPSLNKNQQANQASRGSTARQCPNPECHDKDVGEEDGQIICRGCGTVISESNIVAELQFAETSSGGHLMIGQHIGSDQAHARGTVQGLKNAGAFNSRELTEANGRRYINQIGSALRISQSLVDAGMRVFKLAAANNFIQGRLTSSVSAVSLYIATRIQRDSAQNYMLIDFSDIMQLNVFKLGQIYKDLVEELRINGMGVEVKPINPENLLYRFAERLEFGSDTNAVATDGVRILQRMDRDWMTPGRRPAGVCGAALIIAARMHNYRRTVREMVYVAKVAEVTLMKRLEEFKNTESSGLTVEEFRKIDLERFCDPPAFYEQNSRKKRIKRKRKLVNVDDDGDTDVESQRATSAAPSATDVQLQTLTHTQRQTQIDSQNMPPPPIPVDPTLTTSQPPTKKKRGRPPKTKPSTAQGRPPASPPPSQETPIEPDITTAMSDPSSLTHASALTQVLDTNAASATPPPTQQDPAHPPREPIPLTEHISDSEFGLDLEVLECLLTPTEVEIKTRIWTHENREWIRAQHAKELKQKLAEDNGTVPRVKRRTRRRTRMGDMASYRRESEQDGEVGEVGEGEGDEDSMPARSAAEATMKMMKKRAYSKKINYETLKKLYEPSSKDSSASGSRRQSMSAASGAAASPGAGNIFASPKPTDAVEVTTPSGTTRVEHAEVATPAGSNREDDAGRASSVAMDDIQAIAQEEEEERSMMDPGEPIQIPDPLNEDDEDDDPDDYFNEEEDLAEVDEDDELEDIEDILRKAREKGEGDLEEAGYGDDYE